MTLPMTDAMNAKSPPLLAAAFGFALLLQSGTSQAQVEPDTIRAAIARSLPLLQQGARTFRERSEGRCIACHHQGLVLQTVALARGKEFPVDEQAANEEVERIVGFYQRRVARYDAALSGHATKDAGDPFGNFTVHAGYWLWGVAAEQVKPTPELHTAMRYLAARQWPDGRWSFTDTARAPLQAGDITTTALAAYALRNYGFAGEEHSRSIDLARQWLTEAPVRTTDDKAYRLLGLHWTAASESLISGAAKQLLAAQQPSGAWSQQDNMPPDAYATGLALVALAITGQSESRGGDYLRGVAWLLDQQEPDGSWFVRTRAIPTNPYFESGFPHGKSQFISYAATCFATMALLHAVP
jgi:hypothetical protein